AETSPIGPDVLMYDASVGGSGCTSITSVPPCFGLSCAKPSTGSRTAPDAARVCRNVRRLTVDMGFLLKGAADSIGSPAALRSRFGGDGIVLEFLRRARVKEAAIAELAVERERGHVDHPHRIEDAVEVIALVLEQHGVKPAGHALDGAAVHRLRRAPHARVARHHPVQAGNREAALPDQFLF